jgi:hypothetical protein
MGLDDRFNRCWCVADAARPSPMRKLGASSGIETTLAHGTVTDPAACQPEFPLPLFRAAIKNTWLPANAALKAIARCNVSVLPLADAELPTVLMVHWLFCKLKPDDNAIGDPGA